MSHPLKQAERMDLPEYPARAPGPDAPIGELLAYVAGSSRRVELWLAMLYAQQEAATAAAREAGRKRLAVSVRDVEIPFWSMVGILVTVALAAIPALIILFLLGLAFAFVMTLIGLGFAG